MLMVMSRGVTLSFVETRRSMKPGMVDHALYSSRLDFYLLYLASAGKLAFVSGIDRRSRK